MIRYIFVLLSAFLLFSPASYGERLNDLEKPGEKSSIVFGRIVNRSDEGKRAEVAIREYFSDFEIRVPLKKNIFSARLPKGIYRIASAKHDKISENLSFLKAKKLKNCIFIVPESGKVYYLGDLVLDMSDYEKKRVKESQGLPLDNFIYTYHIKYSVEDNSDEAIEDFKALNGGDIKVEKSIINSGIDIEKLKILKRNDPEKNRKNIDNAIKTALIKKDNYFFIFRFGGYFGGDRLASISSDSVHAGDAAEISLGVFFKPFLNRNYETQITIGSLDTRTVEFDNYYEFEKYTLEVMEYYRFRYVRVGGGLTYHMSPVLKGHGTVSGEKKKFDDALGFTLETDAFFGFQDIAEIFLGVRYTFIDYEINGTKYDGNSLGIVMGLYF